MRNIVRLVKVESGRTKNHLIFRGYISRLDSNFLYEFDYTGVEIEYTNASVNEFAKNNLCNCLNGDFGYAPFDLHKARNILGDGIDYSIELWEEN